MEVPEPIAVRCSAIVLRGSGLLLCRHRADEWALPGGSPRRGEGAAACAEREVFQETGLRVLPRGVAFVFDVTSPSGDRHLYEVVFAADEADSSRAPIVQEQGLTPAFLELDSLGDIALRPAIGQHLKRHADRAVRLPSTRASVPYLGNLWQPVAGAARR